MAAKPVAAAAVAEELVSVVWCTTLGIPEDVANKLVNARWRVAGLTKDESKFEKVLQEAGCLAGDIDAAWRKWQAASSPSPVQPSAESSPPPPATSNAHLLELVQELVDAHREKKQRKSAVAMSDVCDDVWLELQAALGLEVKTVGCNLSVTGSVTAFKWDERDEDKRSDYSDWWQALLDPKKVRVAVMNGNAGNYSLTIPLLEGIPFRLSGTTDVAVVDSHSAITTTPVVGTLFVIEIKKPSVFKKETLHWTRQLQAELLAADYHSQHAPVGLLTDLASEWHFFWFEKDANTKKLCTTVVASAALAVALMRATISKRSTVVAPWIARHKLGLRLAVPRFLMPAMTDDLLFTDEEQAAVHFHVLLHALQNAPGLVLAK